MIMKLFFIVLGVTLAWFLRDHGLSGVYADSVSVPVTEGDSVTLHTEFERKHQESIKWYFSSIRIAQISTDFVCIDVQCNEVNKTFGDRLKLDHQTGSLTIMNITNTDSGEYELRISISEKIFSVSITDVPATKPYDIKEGESVTLDAGVIKHPNNAMTWYFNDALIAEITGDQSKICTDDQCNKRFRDRLKLDQQTESLTITNTRITDSGDYKLEININSSTFSITRVKRFSVSITAVPDSGLSAAAVAGVVVVAVLLVAAVAVVVVYRNRRSRTVL